MLRNFPVTCSADRTRKLILGEVADAANQVGECAAPGIDTICADWAFDKATVHRHLRALVDDGWIEVTRKGGRGPGSFTEYRIVGMATKGSQDAVLEGSQDASLPEAQGSQDSPIRVAGSDSSHYLNGLPGIEEPDAHAPARSSKTKKARTPRPNEERARALTDRVWKAKTPPPVQPFIAIAKIAERFLDCGHAEVDVERAMCHVPTISFSWVEAEIAKSKKQSPSRVVDDDRDTPSGEVKL